jgi:hypothetical protein
LVLVEVSDTIWMQIAVSVVGVALLTLLAWYRSWSRKLDKARRPPVSPNPAYRSVELPG